MENIVRSLDKDGKYTYRLSLIVMQKDRNNSLCQGADQQSANYLYRIMDMMQIITDIMEDASEKRTKAYWEEHAEERQKLLEEKREHQAAISKIESEAWAINANDEIEPISKAIQKLETERDGIGSQELRQLQSKVHQARQELSEIGFFKFKERKAAQAKLEEAESELTEKQREVDYEKALVQRKIDDKKKQIEEINRRVTERRNVVLSQKNIHEQLVNRIDRKLTQKR